MTALLIVLALTGALSALFVVLGLIPWALGVLCPDLENSL